MPEGHHIHHLAKQHRKAFVGQTVAVSSPQGRFRKGAKAIDGLILTRIEAVGKHLFYHFGDEPKAKMSRERLHIHLGRYGKAKSFSLPAPEPQGQVRLRVIGEEQGFDLRGPTACELLSEDERQKILDRIGPDPLADDDPAPVWERLRKTSREIGALLLDQKVFAGVGNIYRAEVLFELGIDPHRPGKSFSEEEFNTLWETITRQMKVGVKYGKIVTVDREEAGKPLSRVNGLDRFRVYKQPTCKRCEAPVQRFTQAARTMYACPVCQNMTKQAS